MYTKGVLRGFGENVKTMRSVDGNDFLAAIETIRFETSEGVETCTAGALADALKGTPIDYLIDELAQRWQEFMASEDWDKIQGG